MSDNIETIEQVIHDLEVSIPMLPVKDRSFALSLIEGKYGYKKRGSLSEKQYAWAKKMLEKALMGSVDAAEADTEPKHIEGFVNLVAFIKAAGENLKYPKLTFEFDDDFKLQISLAGPKSKHYGKVNLTDGGPYGDNKFFGHIDEYGVWEPRTNHGSDLNGEIQAILEDITEDPKAAAEAYGLKTGNCMFCNSGLKDEKSTKVGYGPVCAKNWGLPHGKKAS